MYTVQVKEFVVKSLIEGATAIQLSRKYKISYPTVLRWAREAGVRGPQLSSVTLAEVLKRAKRA